MRNYLAKTPNTSRRWIARWCAAIMALCVVAAFPAMAFAQGSIFGNVQNANLTNPAQADLYWIGFLDNTDEEIRIKTSSGAGYDGVFWFDDFQNYSTEVAGNPYDFIFINTTNGQYFRLEKPIPNNSFQQEDVILAPASIPARPTGLTVQPVSATRVNLTWNKVAGVTYHVYRRATSNLGAYRRIDDPTGNLANIGTADSFFVDATSDGATDYSYIVIGQSATNIFSAHSVEVSALASAFVSPAVAAVNPPAGSGVSNPLVTITGSNFDVGGVTVTFDGIPATNITVLSPLTITCNVPLHAAGAVDIAVTNTASGLSSTLVGGFTYTSNVAPILAAIGPKNVNEGQNLNFIASASDGDGTTPVLSAINLPANATFINNGNGTGTFNFNPDYTQANVYNVTVIASDGTLADSEVVAITVNNVNRAPVLAAIGAQNVNEGANLNFNSSASDPDGNVPTISALGVPANATFVDNADGTGTFDFDPDFTQSGVINVTFIASDGSLADSEVVAITINNVNRAPGLAAIGPQSVDEGQSLNVPVSATDPDATTPTLSAVNVPLNATFTDNANGTGSLVFNPDFTQAGVYNVTFIASDGALADSEVVAITVGGVNLRPVLAAIGPQSVNEGQPLNVPVSATDPDATIPTLSAVNTPLNSTFTDNGNGTGSLVFNPDFNQSGVYNITFIASDGPLADSEVVAITVNDVSLAPVLAAIGPQSVDEGQPLNVPVSATDPDATIPTLSALNTPLNSTFADNGNGTASFVFNPDYTQAGVYNITFIASDGALADSEVVAVTVNNVNLAPVLAAIGPKNVAEGTNLNFLTTATDPDLTTPALTALNVPLNATFVDNADGTGTFDFNPNFSQLGSYLVTFIASDGVLADSEVVTINVTNTNLAPVLNAIGPQSVDEGQPLNIPVSATDPDATTPSLLAENVPANATFTDNANGTGSFSFAPDFTQAGVYNVRFITTDGSLADTEVVAITVTDVNLAPVLSAIGPQSVDEGQLLNLPVTASDADLTIPTLTAETVPLNATFTDNTDGSGSLVFAPDFTQAGVLNVLFIASDGVLADSELVAITVNDVNRPPVITPVGAQIVDEGSALNLNIASSDPDGAIPVLTAENVPANAVFTPDGNGNGTFDFNPDFTQQGIYVVSFISSDGSLADTEMVSISVNEAGNQRPILTTIGNRLVDEGVNLTFGVTATEPDADTLILSATGLPANALFTDNFDGSGIFSFDPDFTQAGIVNVTFIASDGILADSEVVQITINDINRAPALTTIGPRNVAEGQGLAFNALASDPDGMIPTLTAENLPVNATFNDNANGTGTFSFNPDFTQSGLYQVLFIASDGASADSELVDINVTDAGNQPPILAAIGNRNIPEGDTLSFRVSATDADNPNPVLTVVGLPPGAVFLDSLNGAGGFVFPTAFGQGGNAYPVIFIASDGVVADSESIFITVVDQGNAQPVFDSVPPDTINEGDTVVVLVHAVDPEGTGILLGTLNNVPNALFVDSGNGYGTVRFAPDFLQAGVDTIKIIAIDFGSPQATATLSIIVTVVEKNLPPNLYPIGNRTVIAGDSLKIRLVATDSTAPAGNQLFMAGINLPANATFSDSGGGIAHFKFKPTFGQIGQYNVTFLVTDNGTPSLADLETITITVQNTNQPPVLATIGPKAFDEGDTLEFRVSAVDPDGIIPILSITTALPPNASFVDSGNGAGSFRFEPTYLQAGLYQLNFRASDGLLNDNENVIIQVREAGNQAPALSQFPDTAGVVEGTQILIFMTATDPESQAITFTMTPAVNNAVLEDSANGHALFHMTPDFCQQGFYTVRFIATDALGAADTGVVVLNVVDAGNQTPVVANPGPQTVIERQILAVNVSATDPDCTIPDLVARPLPPNSSFIDDGDGTGTLNLAPDYPDAGSYNVYIVAVDAENGAISDSVLVPVTYADQTRPPVFDASSTNGLAVTMQLGQSVTIWHHAYDLDGPTPVMSAINLRPNMSWADSGNGYIWLTYSPTFSDAPGSFLITFVATDADYDTVTATVQQGFNVGFLNAPPVLNPIGPQTVLEGDSLVFVVTATDPNGTTPVMSAQSLPVGAQFTNLGGGQGRFRWVTTFTQAGDYYPLFRAQDATTIDTERVYIQVIEAGNRIPTFITSFPTDTIVMSQYAVDTFGVRATDLDNPLLTLSVPNLPPGALFLDSLNNGGRFIFDPDVTAVGQVYNVLFVASDGAAADTGLAIYHVISFLRGDWNSDGVVDVVDVVAEINHAFRNAPPPIPWELGNFNGDAAINILDVVIMVDYAFRNGPPLPP